MLHSPSNHQTVVDYAPIDRLGSHGCEGSRFHSSHGQRSISQWLALPFIGLIYLYRWTIRPFLAGGCRFYPSCSHYAEGALSEHGLWHGSILSVRRLLKCHPWHEGGIDPVPAKSSLQIQGQDLRS